MDDHLPSGQSVLSYLERMVTYCRMVHRGDLERDYRDAWETAARQLLGPLPNRPPAPAVYTPAEMAPKPPTPKWRTEILAQPVRRIVARFSQQEKDGHGYTTLDYERLECGHIIAAGFNYSESGQPAKRRRCAQCAKEAAAKKQPQPAVKKTKAVSA